MRKINIFVIILVFTILFVMSSQSLAEDDYEEGDGWEYQDGVLKITESDGLINYIYHDEELINDSPDQQSPFEVDCVIIGKNVTSDIMIEYFISREILSKTTIEEGNPCFVVENGWIINTATKTLFGAENVAKKKVLWRIDDLPTYIEHIGMYAFDNYDQLKQITMPEALTSIGDSAFSDCGNLETITLPNSTTKIGVAAFNSCTSLTEIEFGTQINTIDTAAFDTCVHLKTPPLYNTKIETVHGNSFWGCDQFEIVELPPTVRLVEAISFMLCERLNTFIFTSDHLTIEDRAFTYCENIRKLIFTKGKPEFIGSKLFDEDAKTPDGKSFITYAYDKAGKTIPYPTLYYTAAYAAEWAPNGETEWNGYPIQLISQEELDAVLAEARGEDVPAATPAPTAAALFTVAPDAVEPSPARETSLLDGWMIAAIAAVVLAAGVVVVGAVKRGRKK